MGLFWWFVVILALAIFLPILIILLICYIKVLTLVTSSILKDIEDKTLQKIKNKNKK